MKRKISKLLVLILVIIMFFVGCSKNKVEENGYYKELNLDYTSLQDSSKPVKNVILIIGDGMGENQVKVTKMLRLKNDEKLDLDKMEYRTSVITSCLDNYVTDSAASATAMATGVKTIYERVGMDKDGNSLKTILDYAHESGKKTGVVTNTNITDATPIAFTVHETNRYLNVDKMPLQQITSNVDILMGERNANYYKKEALKLIEDNNYTLVDNLEDFRKTTSNKLIALFSSFRLDSMKNSVPTLAEMTKKSIDILSKNKDGFMLVVESGLIDKVIGDGNISKMADEVMNLDKSLRVALNFARSNTDTLVIVVADHETGGLVIKDGIPDVSWFTEEDLYHTPVNVPLYAFGCRSSVFNKDEIDNTDIFKIIKEVMAI